MVPRIIFDLAKKMYFFLTNLSFEILSAGPLVEAHEVDKSFPNLADEHLFLHCFRLCHTPGYNITQKAFKFTAFFPKNSDFGAINPRNKVTK